MQWGPAFPNLLHEWLFEKVPLLQRKPPFLFALSPSVSSVVRGAVSVQGRGRDQGGLPGDRGQLFYGLDVAAQAVHKLPVPLCKTTGWHVGGDTAILTYIISINNVDEPPPRFRLLTYTENPSTMTRNWQCKMKSGFWCSFMEMRFKTYPIYVELGRKFVAVLIWILWYY